MTLQDLLNQAEEVLKAAGIYEAKTDAKLLWEHVSHMNPMEMLLDKNQEQSEALAGEYDELIKLRATRIPLQYITGVQNFMGFDFMTSKEVLIPRQDTEIVVEKATEVFKDYCGRKLKKPAEASVLDMCCGSGCIGISFGKLTSCKRVVLADISPYALNLSRENARRLDVDCEIIQSDLFEHINEEFDFILSNPPYIKSHVIDELMPEVRDYEPRLALDGDEDGLLFYRQITGEAGDYLKDGGYLFFEIGNDQAHEVLQLLIDAGFSDCRSVRDLAGNDRLVYGRKCKEI